MPRLSISITKEFREAIQQYQQAHNLRSESEAVCELAYVGLKINQSVGFSPQGAWGGDRKSVDFQRRLEQMDVALMGLPPLADDD